MESSPTLSDLLAGFSTGNSAKTQPTYTTVGSIYNPKSATHLQPPSRRPRTRRCPQPLRSPSGGAFTNFPDALLSSLPLEDQALRSPPTTASTLQQYSPLQQNYDRAATPVRERERTAVVGSSMSIPSIRSGNLPSPTAFGSNDSLSAGDTLTSRITVKGLTNLASYPNPMQKAAQNTLARARAANLGFSRPGTPSSLPSTTTDGSNDRFPNLSAIKPAVAGPPQPLKAGPPGQRAFKPSTLDAASRTIRTENPAPSAVYHSRFPIGFEYNLDTNHLTTLDDNDGLNGSGPSVQLPLDERLPALTSHNNPDVVGFAHLSTPGPSDAVSEATEGDRRKVHDTLPPERIRHYFPSGFPSNYDGRHKPVAEDWHTGYPTPENRFMQETFSERMAKINRTFYAGTEGLVRNMEQIVRDHNYRCLENKIGVIGEERERLRGSHVERLGTHGKVQPPALSLNELDQMGEAEIAKPLVNMAFATLLSYKEKSESGSNGKYSWPSGFIKADDAWVDPTKEGNTSFF
ncbi:uncharacterized protein P884DRAFT_274668 [Thermothelomyces heterothallicus CBS 202.75]|uniref:uncharacterized protein n=1 Tax=Thermothelomyces heterothallicus CBS 202.75 TaxID=1149848 RepID=UPI0037435767